METIASSTDIRMRDRAIASTLPFMPRRLVKRFSAPYIAGETLDQALDTIRDIAGRQMGVTVDVLGEAITEREQAVATRDDYLTLLDALATLGEPDLVNVSVKLTALGLSFDDRLAHDLTLSIAERAGELGGFMRIDMEDTPYTDATFDIHRALWDAGHHHVGIVVQAYLKRSRADVERLAADKVPVRLVKGIYIEPEALAYKDMRVINRSFTELARTLLEAGSRTALATHDEFLVYDTQQVLESLGTAKDQYEYQMLLGVREELRDDLVGRGHPVRVYVPYGARWYEYSLRRLRENPRVAGHVAGATIESMRDKLTPGRKRRREARRDRDRPW